MCLAQDRHSVESDDVKGALCLYVRRKKIVQKISVCYIYKFYQENIIIYNYLYNRNAPLLRSAFVRDDEI